MHEIVDRWSSTPECTLSLFDVHDGMTYPPPAPPFVMIIPPPAKALRGSMQFDGAKHDFGDNRECVACLERCCAFQGFQLSYLSGMHVDAATSTEFDGCGLTPD